MWYLFVFIIIVIVVCLYYFSNKNNKNSNNNNNKEKVVDLSTKEYESAFPSIQIIEDDSIAPVESNKISDNEIKNAIATIDNISAKSYVVGNNIKVATELAKNNRAFFSAAKEGTEKMLGVKGTNEVYGIQMKGGVFNKQTKFIRENQLIEASAKNAVVNASFNAASMVVGQYYMNEINGKLENIQNDIKNIQSDLDAEYQGKLIHIIAKIKEILDNKKEILNNSFLRDKRYDEISREEANCTTLLGQANSKIADYTSKNEQDYKYYENSIKEINKWLNRQQILLKLLLETGNLRYVLSYGNETSISAHTQYNTYLLQTNKVNEELEKWHNFYINKFGIDSEGHKRKSQFFEIKKNTIGRINENWAYSKMNENVETMISLQTNIKKLSPYIENKQDQNIKILKKNGEYYNLPEASDDN